MFKDYLSFIFCLIIVAQILLIRIAIVIAKKRPGNLFGNFRSARLSGFKERYSKDPEILKLVNKMKLLRLIIYLLVALMFFSVVYNGMKNS
jgi:hypothetical protein